MQNRTKATIAGGAIAALGALGVAVWTHMADAADHNDPPSIAGMASDIADTYAWHDMASDKLVVAITWAAGKVPSADQTGTYDPDVLYTIHIDNTGDNVSDIQVHARFGQDGAGNWGVQVENLPGADGTVTGAVESNLTSGDAMVYAGLRDDPFFFDLTGFRETLMMGTLRFMPERDFFEGTNATALVLEMSLSGALGGADGLQIWTTTGTIGGGA